MNLWKTSRTIHQSTHAQRHAFKILNQHKFAVIVGRKGDGKTSIAREIILAHTDIDGTGDHKTLIVQIENPDQILEICSKGIQSQIIFLADDALGKSAVDTQKLDKWQRKSDDIGVTLRNSPQFKLVITMRKHIWNKTKSLLEGYDVFDDLIDLTSLEMALQTDEKANILRAHLVKNHPAQVDETVIREVSEMKPTSPGYPQCCYMFSRVQDLYDEGVQFFKKPSSYLQKLLDELHSAEPNLYITLALTLVFRGKFQMKYLSKETLDTNKQVKACIEEIMECCGHVGTKSLGQLAHGFKTLCDVYYKQNEEKSSYRFNHDSIEEAVAKHFGDNYPAVLIKCCHIKSLQQWVCTAEEHRKDHDQHVVFLHKGHFRNLASRLNKELLKGNADVAFSLISAQDDNFVSVWIESLNELGDLEELLDREGRHMFVQAAKNGVLLFVEYLLKAPQRSLCGLHQCEIDTAFKASACNGHTHIMEILFPLRVSKSILERAFELVIEIGHLNSAKCLLDHSSQLLRREITVPCKINSCENVSMVDSIQQHAVHLAAHHGSLDILEYLFSFDINPNVLDSHGKTPLHYSCASGYSSVTEFLLSLPDTDVNIIDRDERTPLYYATVEGHDVVLEQLKNNNANLNLRDADDKTAAELAFDAGFRPASKIIQPSCDQL